jgi:cobalt-zinc-cadmium efflux system protein
VSDVRHLHIWALSTSQNALTAHIVVKPTLSLADMTTIRTELKHELIHLAIQHSTLEIETDTIPADTGDC